MSEQEQRTERRHEGHNLGYRVPTDLCWQCQRNRAVCRSKVCYSTARDAHEAALRLNRATDWRKPRSPYGCPYCGGWHLTSQVSRTRAARWTKQQRKQLAREAVGAA